GTDFQGRDVVNQIVYGGGDIITTAILAALFSTLIAITFGSIAATVGGRIDSVILAITDVALTIPQLILLIVIAAIFRPTSFFAQAAIMFLGLVPLSGRNWAIMLYFAYNQGALFFKDSFFYLMGPIMAIALFQLSLVWLASGLEDVFNPRLRS